MFSQYSLLYGAIAAFGYSLAALFAKSALQEGCGILRFSFICNLVFVLCFASILAPGIHLSSITDWHLPIFAGILFFLGQVLTFAAIRVGDISIQTPIMGTKAVFVTFIAAAFSLREISSTIWLGAFASCVAVALLGFSGSQKSYNSSHPLLSILLSVLSALAFAGSDVMVNVFAPDIGKHNFIFLMILTNGVLSFLLIPFFDSSLLEIKRTAYPFVLLASLGMALQALLLNYTLASSEKVAEINILYSTRGFWSLILGLLLAIMLSQKHELQNKKVLFLRIMGCALMSFSVLAVLS